MMRRRRRLPMPAAMLLAAVSVAASAGVTVAKAADDPRAAMLANTCNGCHGPEGTSRGPAVPTIAGNKQEYLVESMRAFRSGDRPSTIMGRIAKAYSDDEIALMAEYFASRPFGRVADQPADADLVARGKAVYDDLCESCHEERGYSTDETPVLAGQMAPYLANELHDLIAGTRDLEKVAGMSSRGVRKKRRELQELVDSHGEGGIEALVAFFGSLK